MNEPTYSGQVRELPSEERPRERLMQLGPEALRDAELIAILFRSGTRGANAITLAEALLRQFGGLRKVAQASLEEITRVKGLGLVKAIEIRAALELGKRLAQHVEPERPRIRDADDVSRLLMVRFKEYEVEVFKALLLNTKNEVMREVEVSRGSLDGTLAKPCDVYREAVRAGAAAIIVAHNHPSGDPEPSRDDIALTKRLSEAGRIIGVRLLDHVVFGDGRHVSLADRDLLT